MHKLIFSPLDHLNYTHHPTSPTKKDNYTTQETQEHTNTIWYYINGTGTSWRTCSSSSSTRRCVRQPDTRGRSTPVTFTAPRRLGVCWGDWQDWVTSSLSGRCPLGDVITGMTLSTGCRHHWHDAVHWVTSSLTGCCPPGDIVTRKPAVSFFFFSLRFRTLLLLLLALCLIERYNSSLSLSGWLAYCLSVFVCLCLSLALLFNSA